MITYVKVSELPWLRTELERLNIACSYEKCKINNEDYYEVHTSSRELWLNCRARLSERELLILGGLT